MGDSVFQKQVVKLARDVRYDKKEFVINLKKLALSIQRPILETWGFEASFYGIEEAELALQEHTAGDRMDAALKEKADLVTKLLYGVMYETVFMPRSEIQ